MKSHFDSMMLRHLAMLAGKLISEGPPAEEPGVPEILRPVAEVLMRKPTSENIDEDAEAYALKMMHFQLDLMRTSFSHARKNQLSDAQQSRFLLLFGEMYELLGKSEKAADCYNLLVDHTSDIEQINLKGTVLLKLGQLLENQGDLPEAEAMLAEAKETLENASNLKNMVAAEIELAKIAYRKGEYLHAENLFREALEHLPGLADKYHEAVILNHLGVIARLHGKQERARASLQEALVCFQSVNDRAGEAESWSNLGRVYYQQENMLEAVNCFEKATAICQTTGIDVLKAFIQLNKCEIYLAMHDIPLAVAASKTALEIFLQLRHPVGFARTCKMLGTITHIGGHDELAGQFYESSIAFYRELHIPFGLVAALMDYAGFLVETGRKTAAKPMFGEAEKIKKAMQLQQAVSSKAFDALDKNVHHRNAARNIKNGKMAKDGAK